MNTNGFPFLQQPKTLNAFSTVASLGILSKVCCEPSLAEFEQQKTNDVYKRDFSRGEERLKLWRGKGVRSKFLCLLTSDGFTPLRKRSGYPRFRRHLRLLHPALDRMLVEVAFGRVHSRGVRIAYHTSDRFLTLLLAGVARQGCKSLCSHGHEWAYVTLSIFVMIR